MVVYKFYTESNRDGGGEGVSEPTILNKWAKCRYMFIVFKARK